MRLLVDMFTSASTLIVSNMAKRPQAQNDPPVSFVTTRASKVRNGSGSADAVSNRASAVRRKAVMKGSIFYRYQFGPRRTPGPRRGERARVLDVDRGFHPRAGARTQDDFGSGCAGGLA